MSGCMSMSIKRKKRLSPALKKQAATVKKLAAHYRKEGKSVTIQKLAKEASQINKGKKSMPKSSRSYKKKKSGRRSKKRSYRK